MNWYELEVFPPRNYGDLILVLVISTGSWPPAGLHIKHLKYFFFLSLLLGLLLFQGKPLQVCDFSKIYCTIKMHVSVVVDFADCTCMEKADVFFFTVIKL